MIEWQLKYRTSVQRLKFEQQGQSNNIVELAFILTSSIHEVACVTIWNKAIFIDAKCKYIIKYDITF